MVEPRVPPLPAGRLRAACPEASLAFETTADLEPIAGVIGQARALEALDVGLGIRREGYNIVIVGSQGVGKHTVARETLRRRAALDPSPPDICYVFDFADAHRPRALRLPPGDGARLRADLDKLIDDLQTMLPAVLTSDRYAQRTRRITEAMEKVQEQAIDAIRQASEAQGLAFEENDDGFTYGPSLEGALMPPEAFLALPEDQRAVFETAMKDVEERVQAFASGVPRWRKETRDRLRTLLQEITRDEANRLVAPLLSRYGEQADVVEWLGELAVDVVSHVQLFLEDDEEGGESRAPGPRGLTYGPDSLRRYAVNLLVDHGRTQGAPVVYEDNPVLTNLIGRIEHVTEYGAVLTDHTLIKAGALHRASGGYLILDIHRVLGEPFAWSALKRVLRSRLLRMDPPTHEATLSSTISLAPEPLPVDVKVVLLGSAPLYYQLCMADPEFERHFKILAAFEEMIPWTPEHTLLLARLIGSKAREEGLRPLDRDAVARVIESSSREVEDGEYLSANLSRMFNLLDEADYWAERRGHAVVVADDVAAAVEAFERRAGQPRDEVHRAFERGTLMVATDGEVVGQVNGLAVLDLGSYAFGRPTRITATARLGTGEVIDIERESDLSGSLHSKGVLILRSFLGSRFATDIPLSLDASLVFEQSYGYVEGDSASLAELCALLSAIAKLPLRQGLAVTGSINQHGQVQVIGGVNPKIEGFFDLCQVRGLTGHQGVIIPAGNVPNLMLRHDVVEAARAGRFHVWAVDTVEPAMELLTGLPAGVPGSDGHYPPETVYGRVEAALARFYQRRRALANLGEATPEV